MTLTDIKWGRILLCMSAAGFLVLCAFVASSSMVRVQYLWRNVLTTDTLYGRRRRRPTVLRGEGQTAPPLHVGLDRVNLLPRHFTLLANRPSSKRSSK